AGRERDRREAVAGSGRRRLHIRHRCEGGKGEAPGDRFAAVAAARGRLCGGSGDRRKARRRRSPLHLRPSDRRRAGRSPARRLPPAAARREVIRRAWFPLLSGAALAAALTFLVLPVVAIFTNTPPSQLIDALDDPAATDALRLSLETTAIAVAIIVVVGTPAAYMLATRSFRLRQLVITLVEIPLVLPPAVAGIALLAALGPSGILGGALEDAHIELVLQTAGVVVALTFVSAPFYIRQAQAALEAVDRPLVDAARTLGSSEATAFARVYVPIALPGLAAGLALAWARALGEFGATLIFAGSFRGVTQTLPLAIYDQFATNFPAALALSAILVAISAGLLLTVKLIAGRTALVRA